MNRVDIVKCINTIELAAQEKFALLRDHLNRRLNSPSDPMIDYEVDVLVMAKGGDGSMLYSSAINCCLFDKEDLDMEYITMNHNDFPLDVSPEKREFHSYLYHDLTDHSPQSLEHAQTRVKDICAIEMKVTIWEQFRQKGMDLQKAIQIAKENIPPHADTRAVLINEVIKPKVIISAYMFDDDPDAQIDDPTEKREGVEDPYEGVIKYYDLDSNGDMSAEVAARTELLFTDIESSLLLSFSIESI